MPSLGPTKTTSRETVPDVTAPGAPVQAALVGAGQRGHEVFGAWAREHRDRLVFSAVVEPDERRRIRFAEAHGIGDERRFASLEDFLGSGVEVKAVLVASPDHSHAAIAVRLLRAGHEVLLEKPIASDLEELRWLVREAGPHLDRLQVVFELRYTAFYRTIHEIVTSGRLGDVVSVTHAENLAPWFMAHSYVRGNWGSLERAAPAIVAKCSHDLDLLSWNAPGPVVRVASFGSLLHFRPERAPEGATDRCLDDCPVRDCLFDARRVYLGPDTPPWVVSVLSPDGSAAGVEAALRTGPYGRCVYHAGSDVVDHQVVAMELADGSTVTLVFNGHSYQRHASARSTRYDGTRATLRAVFGPNPSIEVRDHDGGIEQFDIPESGDDHGGGDGRMLEAYLEHLRTGAPMLAGARDAVEAHLLGYAAEEARLGGTVVDVAALRSSLFDG